MLTLSALVLSALLAGPVVWSLFKEKRVDLFHPLVLFGLFTFSGFVLPIGPFISGEDPFTTTWFLSYETESSISKAVWVAFLGSLGVILGYAIGYSIRWEYHVVGWKNGWREGLLPVLVGVYSIVGALLFSFGVYKIGGWSVLLGGLGDRIRLFSGLNYFFGAINLLLVAALIWWVKLSKEGPTLNWKFLTFALIAVALNSLHGSKSSIYIFVVMVLALFHLLRRKLSLVAVCGAAGVLIVVIAVYQLVARELLSVGELVTVDLRGSPLEDVLGAVKREFLGHFMQLQMMTVLIERVPIPIPFQCGETFLALLTAPLPVSFFPWKFEPATALIASYLWPEAWMIRGTTMPPGFFGEMYLNFGLIGVACGGGVFGVSYGVCRRWYQARSGSPVRVYCYAAALAMMLHYLRGEVVSPTILFILILASGVLGLRVLSREPRAAAVPSGPIGR